MLGVSTEGSALATLKQSIEESLVRLYSFFELAHKEHFFLDVFCFVYRGKVPAKEPKKLG